jgi:hypothetical protein
LLFNLPWCPIPGNDLVAREIGEWYGYRRVAGYASEWHVGHWAPRRALSAMMDLQIGDDMSTPSGLGSLPYHPLVQEHAPLLSSKEEASQGPFHLGPCQWTRLISGCSAGTVSHQLAIAITLTITSGKTTVAACRSMVCTYSSIPTVAITISLKCSCTFRDCHRRRRIVPLWRLCTQFQFSKQ